MDKKLADILNELHMEVATQLLEKIKSGQATAKDYQAAIALLKHNNITVNPAKMTGEDPISILQQTLSEEYLEVVGSEVVD